MAPTTESFAALVNTLETADIFFLVQYAKELKRARRVFVFQPRKKGTGPLVMVGEAIPQAS